MPARTAEAFVFTGSWDDEIRQHPAMKFMEKYTNAFDAGAAKNEPSSKWLTSDHVLVRSTGQVDNGGDASWAAMANEIYAPFGEFTHIPTSAVVYEVEGGWELQGAATLYWSLLAPGDDGQKAKDATGKTWDGATPAAFKFIYRKDPSGVEGFKLARTEIQADPTAAVVLMLKRGMMKPEQLMG